MNFKSLTSLPVAAFVLLGIASCNQEKPFTINGTLSIPSQIPYGDTIIDIPSPENSMVYLLEDDEPIDSCEVIDNHFAFSGTVLADDAHFVNVASPYFNTLLVIEPGDITIHADGMEQPVIGGTPSNDGINGLLFALAEVEEKIGTMAIELFSSDETEESESDIDYEALGRLQDQYQQMQHHVMDSVYEANTDNLASIYAAVFRCASVQSAAEFEEALASYPDRVKNHPFVVDLIQTMKAQETAAEYDDSYYSFDESDDDSNSIE